jgi:DNA/RNA-binding domain of Phe-tRNA-synthetase-like protein
MSILPPFEFSDSVKAHVPNVLFGLCAAREVSREALSTVVEARKPIALETIHSTLSEIRQNIEAFQTFFRDHGFQCPLPGQLRSIEKKGFPQISPSVDMLLLCEMTNGVLRGVQDLDSTNGGLIYDIAQDGESFEGFRSKEPLICKSGEIVVRDAQAIIASYFQGPDQRTSVTNSTASLLCYVFGAPNLARSAFDDALQMAVDMLTPAAKEVDMAVFEN